MPLRVYSAMPKTVEAVATTALAEEGIEHVALGPGPIPRHARTATDDPRCVAFLGPWLSHEVIESMKILNLAGVAQIAPAATYVGLTRDEPGAGDGMPESLSPGPQPTFFRMCARDTLISRATMPFLAGQGLRYATIVHDETDYGLQLAAQLLQAGLEPEEDPRDANAVIYCGLADGAPYGELLDLAPRPIIAYEGAAVAGFAEAAGGVERVRYLLPQAAVSGWSDRQCIFYAPLVQRAASLLAGLIARIDAPDRSDVVDALWRCGEFDDHGDAVDPDIGVWAEDGRGEFEAIGVTSAY